MYYSGVAMLSLFVHLIVNDSVIRNNHFRKESEEGKAYRGLILSMLGFFAFDALWGVLYDAHWITAVFADTTLYFIAMAATIFYTTRYVIFYLSGRSRALAVLRFMGWLFLAFVFAVLVLNLFYPLMYWFDEQGNYHAGWIRYVVLFFQVILFLTTACIVLWNGFREEGSERRHRVAIVIYSLSTSLAVILQVLYPLLPLYSIGCLIGGCILHTFVVEDMKEDRRLELEDMLRRDAQKEQELGSARYMAYTDSLTGVKNNHAYFEMEQKIDREIADNQSPGFGVIVFDLNDLKKTNDTRGHDSGDQLIRAACQMICDQFKHSPVYRIGGDEFVVILKGEDYQHRQALLEEFNRAIDQNMREGKVVVASGLAEYIPGSDNSYRRVFERADQRMYARKNKLKESAAR